MPIVPFQGIVFDFDGTLATPGLNFQAMDQAAITAVTALLPDPPPKTEPALEWLLKVKESAARQQGVDFADQVCRAAKAAMAEVETAAARQTGLFPGIIEMLENLNKCSVKTGIITRNCTSAVEAAFGRKTALLNCILSRDDLSEWKPDPTHLRKALEKMELRPEYALMVGDDPMDIQVGRACNVRTAAVFCGHVPKEKLLACRPDFSAENCIELICGLAGAGLLPLHQDV